MSYYNSSNEVNPILTDKRKKASTQDMRVFDILKRHGELTAWNIANKIAGECQGQQKGMLITSVRRSLSSLYKSGQIMKSKQVVNHFNSKEWTWQVL